MEGSDQKKLDSSLLVNCLSCQGLVRVNVKAPANSKVRCPHCSESYMLSQILEQNVPELEVVDDVSQPEQAIRQVDRVREPVSVTEEREAFIVPPQLSKGAKRSSRRRSASNRSSQSTGRPEKSSDRSQGNRSRRSSKDSRRSSPKFRKGKFSDLPHRSTEKNGVLELVKIIIGGILAIPIAYMLVFWVFKKDPLLVAPTIERIAPSFVPADLRSQTKTEASPANSNEADTDQEMDQPDESLSVPELDPDKVLKDISS